MSASSETFRSMEPFIQSLVTVESYPVIMARGSIRSGCSEMLYRILQTLCEFDISNDVLNCAFNLNTLEFLRYLINKNGFKYNTDRLSSLLDTHSLQTSLNYTYWLLSNDIIHDLF